jgi:hypothetical protein
MTATLTAKPAMTSEQQRILANNEKALRAVLSHLQKALPLPCAGACCSRTIIASLNRPLADCQVSDRLPQIDNNFSDN